MPYLYRYIDLEKQEVVYAGKVTKYNDVGYNPLKNRHEQHCREDWYKASKDNLIMEFIEFDNACDVDILETWLINFYDTGQLVNKAKTGWGKTSFDLWSSVENRWVVYGLDRSMNGQNIRGLANDLIDSLQKYTEGYTVNIDFKLNYFCDNVRDVQKELEKSSRLARCDTQGLFLRQKNGGI